MDFYLFVFGIYRGLENNLKTGADGFAHQIISNNARSFLLTFIYQLYFSRNRGTTPAKSERRTGIFLIDQQFLRSAAATKFS
jgi:hypothetical protein